MNGKPTKKTIGGGAEEAYQAGGNPCKNALRGRREKARHGVVLIVPSLAKAEKRKEDATLERKLHPRRIRGHFFDPEGGGSRQGNLGD